jgi:sugar phosphate isomerase/epimerase
LFKLGVVTDEISQNVEKSISVAEELGLDCIELRGCWNKNVKDLTNAEVRKIKKQSSAAGLKVVCIASPLFKCNISSEAEVKEHVGFLPRVVKIAKFFDASIVRGFAFWSVKSPERFRDKVIENLQAAANICGNEDIVLALENEPATFVGTGKEARKLVNAANSENLRLVWDPGNAFCAGETPYPDGYLQARGFMAHMHLKDAVRDRRTGKNRFVAVGNGEIDYEGQFKALVNDRYDGCVSIETHYLIQGDGEKSTRETCQGLRNLLKRI